MENGILYNKVVVSRTELQLLFLKNVEFRILTVEYFWLITYPVLFFAITQLVISTFDFATILIADAVKVCPFNKIVIDKIIQQRDS